MKDTLKQIFIIVGFFLVVFVIIFVLAGKGTSNNSGKNYDVFAQCLTDKGAVMYGAAWCAHCKEQKATLGDSFKYIKYVECPDNAKLCTDKGIEGYPTWLFGTSTKKIEGFDKNTTMQVLSDATGCILP